MQTWQLQEAKAKLSKLVKTSARVPQRITLHGEEAAFVVSPKLFHEWQAMKEKKPRKTSRTKFTKSFQTFSEFLKSTGQENMGLSDEEVDTLFARDRTTPARVTDAPLFD